MEEDQELKHMCKFCKKSFPCGRSLGGHMRSHMIMNSVETDEKLNRRKLSSINNGGNITIAVPGLEAASHTGGYGLRENPKKTCRFADSSDEALVLNDKFCKECGKGFPSWKALFGHMKCHSEKERASNSLEDDSWISANQKEVMDSQSDNDAATPHRRRRSRRRRYTAAVATSSSFSFANASSSVSEIEQEQEEVAMCLMMLSRDVGHWGGLNSVAECSDNNSIFVEDPSPVRTNQVTKTEGKGSVCGGDGVVTLKKTRERKFESAGILDSESFQLGNKSSENCAFGLSRNGRKMNKSKMSVGRLLRYQKFKQPNFDDGCKLEVSEVEMGKSLIKDTELDHAGLLAGKNNSRKRKFRDAGFPELGVDSSKKLILFNDLESEGHKGSHKRSRFECTTCNKIFHSYQALGGHRASHKKIKGCFASRIESSENSIETQISLDHAVDSKLMIRSCNTESSIDLGITAGSPEKAETSHGLKKRKGHECPICFRVFASGQALGGHKRSHLLGGSEVKNNQANIVVQKPVSEIRGFLDLNLPAPAEDESNDNIELKPWWAGSSPKQEPLMGLISN